MRIIQITQSERSFPGSRCEGRHGDYFELEFGTLRHNSDFPGGECVDFSNKRKEYRVDKKEYKLIKGE